MAPGHGDQPTRSEHLGTLHLALIHEALQLEINARNAPDVANGRDASVEVCAEAAHRPHRHASGVFFERITEGVQTRREAKVSVDIAQAGHQHAGDCKLLSALAAQLIDMTDRLDMSVRADEDGAPFK